MSNGGLEACMQLSATTVCQPNLGHIPWGATTEQRGEANACNLQVGLEHDKGVPQGKARPCWEPVEVLCLKVHHGLIKGVNVCCR